MKTSGFRPHDFDLDHSEKLENLINQACDGRRTLTVIIITKWRI